MDAADLTAAQAFAPSPALLSACEPPAVELALLSGERGVLLGGPDAAAPTAAPVPAPAPVPLSAYEPPAVELELPSLRADELGAFLGGELAGEVDGLLARVARGRAALDLAVGEGLAVLSVGDRLIRLGYASLADYAREVLAIAGRTADNMAHLARELRGRPLLRAAVRAGEVSIRRAQAVLPLARGDAEAAWVARARVETVRALEAAIRQEKLEAGRADGEPDAQDEAWQRLTVHLSAQECARVDEALALAGKLLGANASRWLRLESLCQEYLGEHPVEAGDDGGRLLGSGLAPVVIDRREAFKAKLEEETERWAALEEVGTFPVPELGVEEETAPRRIDARLREAARMRERWRTWVGELAYLVRRTRLWGLLGFASFAHYAEERLGLSARAVAERAALERRMCQLPALRAAVREGLSYEKARLLSRLPDAEALAWLDRARSMTCIALRRALESDEDMRMRARRKLVLRLPERVALLFAAGCRAVREAEGRLLSHDQCLVRMAAHFVATWQEALRERTTRARRVLERDRGLCQVPGCSHRADHAHHVEHRSHGGSDDEENLASVCAVHHLRGLHQGNVRVWGRAPDALVWELGEREGCESESAGCLGAPG